MIRTGRDGGPTRSPPPHIDVEWTLPARVGVLWLPDGGCVEVFEERPVFGYGRWFAG